MCDPIKSIANRLRGLREVLELSAQEVAESCHLRVEEYMALESGESDISVNVLQTIARRYGISLDVLMFGEEPKMNAYFITRAGAGVSVERRKAYKYEALASGFRDRKADPFIVTVEPAPANAPMHLNSHEGQEMNYVLEGRLLLSLNGKELVLNVGDSLYFDSSLPHGMKAARRAAGPLSGDNHVSYGREILTANGLPLAGGLQKEPAYPRPGEFQLRV